MTLHLHIHLKHLIRRKPLVLVAVLFMTVSALVSFLFVTRGMHTADQLKQQSAKIESFIHDEWADIGQSDRDADDVVVVTLLARSDDAEARAIRQHYLARLGKSAAGKNSLLDVLKASDARQQKRIDSINDNYTRQTALDSEIARQEKRNMFYADLAFILQVIGLLLVIVTRDLPDSV